MLSTAVSFVLAIAGFSQIPSFYHLTTANGLCDNHVRSVAIDKQGFLWVGTEDGLNSYDGHSVTIYLKDKNPALPSDLITSLYCDDQNRTWIGTAEGAAWVDNRKQFYRVVLEDSIAKFAVKAIITTKKLGTIFITSRGHYYFEKSKNSWRQLKEATAQLPYGAIKTTQPFTENEILFIKNGAVVSYNYATNKIVKEYLSTGALSVCKLKGNEIAVGNTNYEIIIIDAVTKTALRRYFLDEQDGNKNNNTQQLDIKQAINGDLIIAFGYNGLVTISPAGIIARFTHDPVTPTSLIGNSTFRIATGDKGEVVVGTSTSGVSMYNTTLSQVTFKGFFSDTRGNYYDNYTGRIAEASDNVFWIGAYDRLIRWDKKSNTSKFYYYTEKEGSGLQRGDIRAVCFDRTGKLWLGVDKKGITYFSEATGFIKLKLDTAAAPAFRATDYPNIIADEYGLLWACTNRGIFTIDPVSKKTDALLQHPVLKQLSGKYVQSIFFDSKKRMWFSTIGSGVYCYDKKNNSFLHYTTKDGLPSDICYMVVEDKKGHYYIPTSKGISIFSDDGSITSLTQKQGLRYDRCESVVIDDTNMVWFSNRKYLVRLNPITKSLEFFDEKVGLLNDGFRVGSCLKTNRGELLWGGYRGISSFNPLLLKNTMHPLQVSVPAMLVRDSLVDLTMVNDYKIRHANNNITFELAAVHLGIPGKTYYQYKFDGFDKDWQKDEDIRQARYTALPPGNYTFNLKASLDGVHWVEAGKKITITITPALWMRWWFIALAVALLIGTIYWLLQNRNKKIKQHKEELDAEQAINYFASSLHEQQTVDTILWDVARNCIGRLQFEDCVVYLLDEKRNMLIQKAAFGPKSPKNFQIAEPLEIPVGRGITGAVALNGKAELVADTTKDSRYIIDDERRFSEIAVPLIWGEKVIGVIDCEHHKKNYFTQKHLSILTTIASLCANKIIRARAEEEKQKTQNILSTTQQKMAEVEMQALRAQMNPHFIFNCLNSINRYIVKSDQATASLYLTRFAKLIRLILDNSSSKNVLLSNELEALKLYIEMEALRFDKKFSYEIIVDKNVNTDSIELPPLIIQPYVENAIWHGLLHKDGGGKLTITISMANENMLETIIEDNGVGRNKARELKSKSATSRKSLGMQLTENRLTLLNRHAELNASIDIIDMEDYQQQPTGTKVIVRIPV